MGSTFTTKLIINDKAFKKKLETAKKNVRSFGKESKKAGKETKGFSGKLSKLGSELGTNLTSKLTGSTVATSLLKSGMASLAIGMGAVVIGVKFAIQKFDELIERAKKAALNIDLLAKTSQKLGLSTNEFSSLRLGAQLSGVNDAAFDVGLRFFIRRVGELRIGLKDAEAAFTKVENITGIKKSVFLQQSTVQQLGVVADAIRDTTDASKKLALAKLFGGDSGAELVNFFNVGAEGIKKFREELEKLGGVITPAQEAIAAAIRDNNALAKIVTNAKNLSTQPGIAGVSTIDALSDSIQKKNLAGRVFDQPGLGADLFSSDVVSKADREAIGIVRAANAKQEKDAIRGQFTDIFDFEAKRFNKGLDKFVAPFKVAGGKIKGAFGALAAGVTGAFDPKAIARSTKRRLANEQAGNRIFERNITPLEKLDSQQEELNRLRNKGFLSPETFNRDFKRIQDERTKLLPDVDAKGKDKEKKTDAVIAQLLSPSRKGSLETLKESILQLQGGKGNVQEKILETNEEQQTELEKQTELLKKATDLGLILSIAGI